MSLNSRVVLKKRQTITALPLYYSGHLLKKKSTDKDFQSYHGELRGATLFLYTDDTQDTYTEKLELVQMKSMKSKSPYQKTMPTVFTLIMQTEEVQLKMDNADKGEEWRGYIMTVANKEIPSKLQLLPGQIMKLEETLASEKKRTVTSSRPELPPRPAFLQSLNSAENSQPNMPACFFNVTRTEAERMLEENPENGSIILRPSTMPNNYAVTLRQMKDSKPVMKNYRVTSINSEFIIELDTAVKVPSLNDVLTYILEKTDYRLSPYVLSHPYDVRIEPSPPPKCVTQTTSKEVPKAQVAPMQRPQTEEKPPPFPAKPAPLPAKPIENNYVVPDHPGSSNHNVDMEKELRDVLQLRRGMIYATQEQEKMDLYENDSCQKISGSTVEWTANSSTA